jgi:hypothetical protein
MASLHADERNHLGRQKTGGHGRSGNAIKHPLDGRSTMSSELELSLSILFADDYLEANVQDTTAVVQVRPNHGQVRLEAAETDERTVEAVIEGRPEAMAALADELYRTASTVASRTGGDDR